MHLRTKGKISETSSASLTLVQMKTSEWIPPTEEGSRPVIEHSYLSPPEHREKLRHICPGVSENKLVICKQIHKSYPSDEAAEAWTRDKTL